MCKAYMSGMCKNGAKCEFSHDANAYAAEYHVSKGGAKTASPSRKSSPKPRSQSPKQGKKKSQRNGSPAPNRATACVEEGEYEHDIDFEYWEGARDSEASFAYGLYQ